MCAVADEHVCCAVGVAGHQVGGIGGEGDVPSVPAEHGSAAGRVTFASCAVHTDAARHLGYPVPDEDVDSPLWSPGTRLCVPEAEATYRPFPLTIPLNWSR